MKKTTIVSNRIVNDAQDCIFYHTMDIPGHGLVQGQWDLRGREAEYLGHVDLAQKTVLEVGTASGHLGFYMEKQGAQVTGYDLSEDQEWDVVPYADFDIPKHIEDRKEMIRRLNNGFWFAHRHFQSKMKVVYGAVYDCPSDLDNFDVATFGSILLHLRDPLQALKKIAEHVKETIVVTDVPLVYTGGENFVKELSQGKLAQFQPRANAEERILDTWWYLSPELVIEYLKILGFKYFSLSYHTQLFKGEEHILYTIIGQRHTPVSAGTSEDRIQHAPSLDDRTPALAYALSRFSIGSIVRYLFWRIFRAFTSRVSRAAGSTDKK